MRTDSDLRTGLLGGRAQLTPEDVLGRGPTLVGVAGSRFAQPMVDAWVDGVAAKMAPSAEDDAGVNSDASAVPRSGGLQLLRLSLVEGAALSMLRTPLRLSMRLSVPSEQRAGFVCHFGDVAGAREKLRMTNRFLGYACLVDAAGMPSRIFRRIKRPHHSSRL